MADPHTCTVSVVNLILAVVLFTESHFFQLSSEMVGGAAIEVPVGVHSIRRGGGRSRTFLVLGKGDVEAAAALDGGVVWLLANLANTLREIVASSIAVATTSIAAAIWWVLGGLLRRVSEACEFRVGSSLSEALSSLAAASGCLCQSALTPSTRKKVLTGVGRVG